MKCDAVKIADSLEAFVRNRVGIPTQSIKTFLANDFLGGRLAY